MPTDRLCIFVDSFDGHSDVWKPLFENFDYFWKDCPYSRYLVTNNKDYQADNLEVIKAGDEIDWFITTLTGLKKVTTKYIWLFLDDYFLSKQIRVSDIEEILDVMDEEAVFFYRMSLRPDLDRSAKWQPVTSDFVYAINLQAAIWNREKLIEILVKLHNEGLKTPWEFEKHFIEHFESLNSTEPVKGVLYDTRDLMGYQNAIIQGKWVGHVIRFYKKQFGITIDTGTREVMPLSAELFDLTKQKGHALFNYQTRRKMKKILSKTGLKFMTK